MKIKVSNNYVAINGELCIYNNGTKFTYRNNKRHRSDGPAIEYHDGDESWILDEINYRKYGLHVNHWQRWT